MHSKEMETRPVRVPVLTMLWNIGEDISKLFSMGLEEDKRIFKPDRERWPLMRLWSQM
jgi:hypothetical protein